MKSGMNKLKKPCNRLITRLLFFLIVTQLGFALGIFPILTVIGVLKLRKEQPAAIKMGGFPFTQIIYVATGVGILVLAYLERPVESSIALLTVITGIPAYYIFKRTTKPAKT
jgi:APA family basic amino acid/polyamine antiporter